MWLANAELPGLAMTRCFGDTIGMIAGVISEPEILEFKLQSEDHFILVGSDGFFEYFSDEDVDVLSKKDMHGFEQVLSDSDREGVRSAAK